MNMLRSKRLLAIAVGLVVLAGCRSEQETETLRQENRVLMQRVTELQEQLQQADAPSAVAPQPTEPAATDYIVREGDNLWSIARKELGSGTRYKEILALNPHISRNQPLPIGTVLKLPAR